jgi:hypothetical protein
LPLAHASQAAVNAEEAKQLSSTLTEFGAENSGNAGGTIPAYIGGIDPILGYNPTTVTRFFDPFPDEKSLYLVTAENL